LSDQAEGRATISITGILAVYRACAVMIVVEMEEGARLGLSLHKLEDDHVYGYVFT
jgi:hypothetical protein